MFPKTSNKYWSIARIFSSFILIIFCKITIKKKGENKKLLVCGVIENELFSWKSWTFRNMQYFLIAMRSTCCKKFGNFIGIFPLRILIFNRLQGSQLIVVLMFSLLTLNRSNPFLRCFYGSLWTRKCRMVYSFQHSSNDVKYFLCWDFLFQFCIRVKAYKNFWIYIYCTKASNKLTCNKTFFAQKFC